MTKNYTQFLCIVIFLFSFSFHVSGVSDSLINTNSSWKYLDNGSNQGTAWRATNFNDASWATGNAELGYGDGDEATIVSYGPNPNGKYITAYFRKSFSIANPAIYSSLTLGILRDDGAIVYLNGTEVYRTNMPGGNVNYLTKAVSNINGIDEATFYYYTFTSPFLVTGINNISVEIHQFNKTSPDISFNFNLAALQISPCVVPAGLTTTNITSSSAILNWNSVAGAVGYNIQYRVIGNPAWTSTSSSINSVLVSGLSTSTAYEWHVQADCGGSNVSAFSATANFATLTPPCGIPPGLSTTSITTTSATLSWTAVIGAVGYNIEYRVVGNPVWSTTTSATTSVNISSLTPSTNYEWHVQANCGSSNLSAFSATANFATLTPACGVPTGLNTTNITSSSATLSWTAVSGAVSYNIEYRVVGNPVWSTTTSAATSVNISSLTPATNYEWHVQSNCGSSNLSAFSATANFTMLTPACGVPTGLNTTNITSSSATLNWTAVIGAVGYNIEYRVVGNPIWSATTSATISVNISSLTPATNYEWHVQADCGSPNLSAFSATSNFTTVQFSCGTPAGLNATNITTTSVTLNWTVVSGAVGYNIEYRVVTNPVWNTATSAANSVNISSLTPYTNYEWHVQADCGSSNLSTFSVVSNFTTLMPPCLTPIGLTTTNITSTSATLNWTAVSGAVGYNIEYRDVGNPVWTVITSVTSSVNISSLTPSTNYEWQVQTNCGSLNLSAFSATANFTTLIPSCGVPGSLSTSNITTTSATLNWNPVSGAVSYNIQYRQVGSPIWINANTVSTFYPILPLNPSTNYEWQVQAVCAANQSAFSQIVSFFTLSLSCNIPTGTITHSIAETFAVLRWNAVGSALSYNVKYKPLASASWTTSNTTQLYFNYTSLSPGTEYEWQVQAVCITGTSSFSNSVIFRTVLNGGNDSIIVSGDEWKYLDKGFDMTGWTGLIFDDSQWGAGPSELGYGDSDEATVVSYGPDPNFKYITTYFRKIFNVPNPALYYTMILDVVRDDGVIIYVNGTEVYRNNMPGGPATYNTFASSAVSLSDESDWHTTTFSPALLTSGNNIIAAEVHQVNQTSSDISFNLRLTGSDTVPLVTRGPYLQEMTQNSIIVRWRTNFATDSRVRYSLSPSDYNLMAYDPAITTEHSVVITGLQYATSYYYTVETGTYFLEGDVSYVFLTQPPNIPNYLVQIWALGDFGNGSAEQLAVRNAFRGDPDYPKTDLFLWLGDNAYENGTDNEYQSNVFDVYKRELRRFPLFPVIGNHDYANVGYQSSSALTTGFPYFNIVTVPAAAESGGWPSGTEKYYSYNYYGIHFIALDSYGAFNDNTSAMYTWLLNDLNENTQRWTIVYFHHPPYTKGSHNSDTETELINMRQNIIPLLESRHVDLVLSGHSHVNERSFLIKGHYGTASTFNPSMLIQGGSGAPMMPYLKNPPYDGTVYVVCGTGGKIATSVQPGWPMPCMYFSDYSQNASLVIDVDWNILDCRFLSSTGVNIDQFRIVKSGMRQDGTRPANESSLTVYPNPFTGEANVFYTLTNDGPTELNLYNPEGEKIHSFTNGMQFQSAGNHEFKLSPGTLGIAPGIYFVRLIAGENVWVQKVVFIR